ncbi:MAG TPA: hypothetical protein VFT50_07805 [Baekduia sp.]|nr:hypothetical protein [Baekduia sp.]
MGSSVPRVIGRSCRMAQSGRRLAAALAGAALLAAAAGCGGDDSTVAQPAASAPSAATATAPAGAPTTTTETPGASATTTTPAATTPAGTTTAPTATTGLPTGGEDQPGGAGDEEPIRVPAAFRVEGGEIVPRRITLPAFLPVALAITAVGGRHQVTVEAGDVGTLDVAEGGTARRTLDGLKPGDYAIVADSGGRATLHVTPGGDAGP